MIHRTFETTNAFGIVRVLVTEESAIIQFIPFDKRCQQIDVEVPFTQERLQEIDEHFTSDDLDEMLRMNEGHTSH